MKVTINKNEAGSFRIPFHNREQMHLILEKIGCHTITDGAAGIKSMKRWDASQMLDVGQEAFR